MTFRAGFACFVGRPNAGKVDPHQRAHRYEDRDHQQPAQTTRPFVRGVLHRRSRSWSWSTLRAAQAEDASRRTPQRLVRATWSEVDVVGLCIPADEPVAARRLIASEIATHEATLVAVVTRPISSTGSGWPAAARVQELGAFADIVPVSAVSGGTARRAYHRQGRTCRLRPALYPDDMITTNRSR